MRLAERIPFFAKTTPPSVALSEAQRSRTGLGFRGTLTVARVSSPTLSSVLHAGHRQAVGKRRPGDGRVGYTEAH